METSYEALCREVEWVKGLKHEDRTKEMEDRMQRMKDLEREIVSNMKEIQAARVRLEGAIARAETVKTEYAETLERRQNGIALGLDVKDINALARGLKDEQDEVDLLEDTQKGLQRRIENLNSEGVFLESEKEKSRKTILRLKVIPLVGQFNATAELLGKLTMQISDIMVDLGESFGWFASGQRTLFPSNFEALEVIPLLHLAGEKDLYPNGQPRDAFRFRAYKYACEKERSCQSPA